MKLRSRGLLALAGAAALIVPLVGAGGQAALAGTARPLLATTTTPNCVITPAPSSFVESGLGPTASSVAFVFQVECKPVYGEQAVEIDAFQLSNACHDTLSWYSDSVPVVFGPDRATPGRLSEGPDIETFPSGPSFDVTLDDDGNATAVVWGGPSCAASRDLVEATLTVAPYTVAKTHVTIEPPVTTKEGLSAYPASEVEDSTYSGVDAIFYAEFPSVYAEDTVQFSDSDLYNRCHGNIIWVGPDEIILGFDTKSVITSLDDNGNAFVVALAGPSCASGYTSAQADLYYNPPYTTLGASFTILSPRVTD